MKRILSVLLCVFLFFGVFAFAAGAIPVAAGDDALRAQFGSGSGGGLTYKYFAPDLSDGVKYPVVVWLHGIASGNYEGDQLDSYDLCKWASDEYQARFENAGGAFILCPRASGTWDLTTTAAVKNCVEDFISRFEGQADRNRIYLMGFSIGASMTIKTAADYPDYFAAAVPVSAVDQTAASGLSNMAVWFFANEKDSYVSANAAATRSTFRSLSDKVKDKTKIRFTWVSQAVDAYGNGVGMQHYMWRTLTNDMFMADGSEYAFSATVDGAGNTIRFFYPDGAISWLSQQSKNGQEKAEKGSTLWDRIVLFFRLLRDFFVNLFS